MLELRILAAAAAVVLGTTAVAAAAAEPTVVTLTQVGCQFIESENGVDHGYKPKEEADCNKINGDSGSARLAKAKTLELKPGKYVFRVTNKNVPYELGFWLRESDYQLGNPLHKLSKISVSGGGMTTGKTIDYEVDLKPGRYLYSCPLNPTPDYTLLVKG
jgi:hypothetical protein